MVAGANIVHAYLDALASQQLLESMAGVSAALMRVVNETPGPAGVDRRPSAAHPQPTSWSSAPTSTSQLGAGWTDPRLLQCDQFASQKLCLFLGRRQPPRVSEDILALGCHLADPGVWEDPRDSRGHPGPRGLFSPLLAGTGWLLF